MLSEVGRRGSSVGQTRSAQVAATFTGVLEKGDAELRVKMSDSSLFGADERGEKITVTYAASPAVLSAPLAPHFTALLQQQLPLRNLHWRPSQATLDSFAARAAQQGKAGSGSSAVPGSTIRTIQNLEVALKPLTDEIKRWRGDPGYFEQPVSTELLARPFVHLYLVVCEDNEHYRVTVRNEIRSWISSLSFFHTQQAAAVAHASSKSPVLAQSGKASFTFGRSATPPVRPDTPQRNLESSSRPQTPASVVPIQSASLLPSFPSEPEYLIVLISPPEGAGINGLGTPGNSTPEPKSGMGRLITKTKATVLEKIKADFNTSKKEHVIQLSRLPPVSSVSLGKSSFHSMDPTIWAELLTKMKEAASATFTTTVEAQEDEILRCGATRGQQSWDFCSYFLAKDSLARTLEGVGLKDDAVGQYEDLEQVFSNAIQNGAVSFAPVGGDSPNDDSLPLLDVTKKPYQDMIRRREISLFDFRCYLFARKSILLAKMGRVAAVMRESPLFIGAVGRMLQRNSRLSKQWIESWMFSAALDVVEQCQACLILRGHTNMSAVDDQLSPAFHSNKSELLDLARRQLDRIGIYAGHLPASGPFDALALANHGDGGGSVEHEPSSEDQAKLPSRPELIQAIQSRDYFDSQYLALCERILVGWNTPSRQRSFLRVKTILAAFDFHRQKYENAYTSFASLTEAYADCKYGALELHCLTMQLECHSRLLQTKDRTWLNAMLAVLKLTSRESEARSTDSALQKWRDPEYLMQELRVASTTFDKEIPILAFPLFSVLVAHARAKLVNSEDGSLLSVTVLSSLPFVQEVDDIRVCLISASKNILWYTSSKITLKPGVTKLELFCPNPSWGTFSVDVTQIRVSKLIFQYTGPSVTSESGPSVVQIPKDGASVDVSLDLPQQIDLDQPRMVEIRVYTGRNDIETAEIAVQNSVDGKLAIESNSAKLTSSDSSSARIETTGSTSAFVIVKNLARETTNTVLVPLAILPESGSLSSIVTLSYTVTSIGNEPRYAAGKRRILRKPATINTALPLGVNVQDFFRATCLLSKFTISAAGGAGSLRLRPAQLMLDEDGGKDANISARYSVASSNSVRETTVTPRQPSTYVFRISKRRSVGQGPENSSPTRFRLSVEYRTLKEEAIARTLATLDRLIDIQGLAALAHPTPTRRLLDMTMTAYVGERLNLPAYSIASEIRTGALDASWWIHEQRSWGHGTNLDVVALVQRVFDEVGAPATPGLAKGEWRKLTIPVEIPTMDFVHTVSIDIASSASAAAAVVDQGGPFPGHQASLVVGQPVTLMVSISSSAMWASTNNDADETRRQMVYDVVPDFEKWLVSGPKRGLFVARLASAHTADGDIPSSLSAENEPFQVQLTLVPLKTGFLTLPTVLVRPVNVVRPAHAQQQADAQSVVTCETYTYNGAERVQVVPATVAKGVRSVAAPHTRQHSTQQTSTQQAPATELAPVIIT